MSDTAERSASSYVRRRTLSPDSLLDLDAVRAFAAANSLRDTDVKNVSRAAVVDGSTGSGGMCEDALLSKFALTSTVHSAHPTTAQRGFKLVVRMQDGQLVETVAIVHEAAAGRPRRSQGRITVCVSSQVGCKMGCTFCATGTMGLRANLTAGEIVEQVWHVERTAPSFGVHWRVSNVVFMGMGEPLNNYKPVMGAVRALKELWGMNPSKITISTVGVVNRIKSLASDAHGVSLALSLHAATQATRVKLVPSGSAFTMDKLMSSVDAYIEASGRGVMIEYILIADVNDTDDEAKALADLLLPRSKNVVLNLIPYNRTTAGDSHGYQSPSVEEVRRFAATLSAAGAPCLFSPC